MIVREATTEDAKRVAEINVIGWHTAYKGLVPDDFLANMPFDEDIIRRTADRIQEHEYYVAEVDDHVVGFASLEYPEEKVVEIMALYIHPDFQKKGVGSALVNYICQHKKDAGYNRLVLWTIKNGPSVGFYQKQGLQLSNMVQKFWKCNVPIIRLEKEL